MTANSHPVGVLLIQLGTPDSPSVKDVRRYLREFLSDPFVMDIPAPARTLLLNGVILPFRPRKSAEAYEKIWTEDGSPLLLHTEALRVGVQRRLGDGYRVAAGMRYGSPSLQSAIEELVAAGCSRVILLPLFPQYAAASTGSALAAARRVIAGRADIVETATVEWFYNVPGFVDAVAQSAEAMINEFRPDHVLFSYHGLPEQQVRKADPSEQWCLRSSGCCDRITDENRSCYRAQSYATTRSLARALGLEEGRYSTAFQSRLAGQKWIEPYTDHELTALYRRGVRRLAVLTPSFTADCLETVEEIGIRGRDQWLELGGKDMLVVPCLNADAAWTTTVADIVRAAV
ncbi:MAG: ferrochelatase [Actinomycetota bacterium]